MNTAQPLRSLAGLLAGVLLASLGVAAESSPLYDHAGMKAVALPGLTVWLGQPVEVTAQIGWGMDWVHPDRQPGWSFIHLTPFLAKFPDGHLVVTYTMDPDTQENPYFLSAFQISKDQGAHWDRRYATLIQHIPMVFLPKPHDALLAIASELLLSSDNDTHNLVGPSWLFEHGGAKVVMVPDGVHLVDWPWVSLWDPNFPGATNPQPRNNWHIGPEITGTAINLGGDSWIASAYGRKGKAALDSAMVISSQDGGKTWRYYSTIADGDPANAGKERFEGANETSLVRLADHDLMAVFRTGSGEQWHIRRSYSHDDGRTWSPSDVLPAWSVEPQVIRAENGTIALATGRPGLYVWFSTDPRATHWQQIDIAAYHNSVIGDPNSRIGTFVRPARGQRPEYDAWQTTAYTALVETSPNHLLLVYDRDAERKPVNDKDISRVYVLPIEVERK